MMSSTTINSNNTITLMGSGLAGSVLALLLGKKGFNVRVHEKRSLEVNPAQRARSINLALSDRGIKTLRETGHLADILEIAIPMKGRMIHSIEGNQTFQPYSSDSKKHLYSVSRQLLNEKLGEHASKLDNVEILYNQTCKSININQGTYDILDKDGQSTTYSTSTIIGCDGAFSAVRNSMVKLDRQNYSQSYLEHGYKELCIPPGENGAFLLDKNSLHIWPRGSFMMIALPNIDGSFTCTLFFPFDGELSFKSLDSKEKVHQFFTQYFADAYKLMPTLLDDYFSNPTSSLVTVKTSPWNYQGKCTLVGDAAHAIVPFYGQGMNAAFEDVLELVNCFDKAFPKGGQSSQLSNETLWECYNAYQNARKANSDAIAEMAIENFIEMRDSVSDPMFLFKKKVEHLLEQTYPNRFVSRYELISYSTEPYAYAQKIGLLNQQILNQLVKDANFDISKIDLALADKLITQVLNK
ncbi:hypothetical protein CYY_005759 [Polysphondylium violaceum]|uniref:Kynurenine 3-monooxygenase n=1 Tax=Polysphondylium violaceum TaxID=133409 RepID=A0A8J4PSZ8_9MYCE|nr:hypothetical protein CYY_005759 [Polysphondylium violaceum]